MPVSVGMLVRVADAVEVGVALGVNDAGGELATAVLAVGDDVATLEPVTLPLLGTAAVVEAPSGDALGVSLFGNASEAEAEADALALPVPLVLGVANGVPVAAAVIAPDAEDVAVGDALDTALPSVGGKASEMKNVVGGGLASTVTRASDGTMRYSRWECTLYKIQRATPSLSTSTRPMSAWICALALTTIATPRSNCAVASFHAYETMPYMAGAGGELACHACASAVQIVRPSGSKQNPLMRGAV